MPSYWHCSRMFCELDTLESSFCNCVYEPVHHYLTLKLIFTCTHSGMLTFSCHTKQNRLTGKYYCTQVLVNVSDTIRPFTFWNVSLFTVYRLASCWHVLSRYTNIHFYLRNCSIMCRSKLPSMHCCTYDLLQLFKLTEKKKKSFVQSPKGSSSHAGQLFCVQKYACQHRLYIAFLREKVLD